MTTPEEFAKRFVYTVARRQPEGPKWELVVHGKREYRIGHDHESDHQMYQEAIAEAIRAWDNNRVAPVSHRPRSRG